MVHGKYDIYIWPAYGVSALVIAAMVLDTVIKARRWKNEVARRQKTLKDGRGEP